MNSIAGSKDRWYPHLTVASIAIKDGKYLLVRESSNGKTVINQPAGHVEKGESMIEAVIRETLEESGWHFEPKYISGIYQFIPENGETYLRFTYYGDISKSEAALRLDPVIEEVIWMSKKEMLEMKHKMRSQAVLQCITDFESGNRLPLDVVQQLESRK